jgi:hypothetical protein
MATLAILSIACTDKIPATSPTAPTEFRLDRAATLAALEYWQSAAGITFQVESANELPRLLIRSGSDIANDGGRGGIDGTYPENNRARSGIVVFATDGGPYCRTSAMVCRFLYRHEIGHAIAFLDHSSAGLMEGSRITTDTLSEREHAMIAALYSLPHGARVEPDGTWHVVGTGQTGALGALDDLQAARDIIDWNMNAVGSSSYRTKGVITRWELPLRVVLRDRP